MALDNNYDATDLRKFLSILEDVRATTAAGNADIQVPDLVVCGGQSCGKSSVLAALAGVNLPRSETLTTRVPLRLSLIADSELEEGNWSARIGIESSTERLKCEKQHVQYTKLGDRIEEITNILAGSAQHINCQDEILLEVVRKNGPTTTLVDLPGIAYVNPNGQENGPNRRQVTVGLVNKYIVKENTIILLVVSAAFDIDNQEAIVTAEKVDPSGSRTLCVLTNVDRTQADVSKTIATLRKRAGLGVVPVKNPDRNSVKDMSPKEAREEETKYFIENYEALGVGEGEWGIAVLGDLIMKAQSAKVKKVLPGLQDTVNISLREMQISLGSKQELFDNDRPEERVKGLRNAFSHTQQVFRDRAKGTTGSSTIFEYNIGPRTKDKYADFKDEVNGIACEWLGKEYEGRVKEILDEFSGTDILSQNTNAEITLFNEVFNEKLPVVCEKLVSKIRVYVENVLNGLLENELNREHLSNARLKSFLKTQVQGFIEKRHIKAMEVVGYLCKAELTKRFTQDETYNRVQGKLEAHARKILSKINGDPNLVGVNIPSPQLKVVDEEDSEDLAGIPHEFISRYVNLYDQALKPGNRNSEDKKTSNSAKIVADKQLSLFAFSKVVTQRISDIVPMQVHLLLVTAVFDTTISADFKKTDFQWELGEGNVEQLKDLTSPEPKLEMELNDLKKKIEKYNEISSSLSEVLSIVQSRSY